MQSKPLFFAVALLVTVTTPALASDAQRLASLKFDNLTAAPQGDPSCLAASRGMATYVEEHGLHLLQFGAKRYDTADGRRSFCVAVIQGPDGGARYEKSFSADGVPLTREVRLSE